jgi:hypothetical protein
MANASRGLAGAASGAGTGAALGTVIPGLGNLVGAGIGAGVGGLIGMFSGDGHDDEISALQQQALEAIRNVDIPKLEEMRLALQKYQLAGQLDPAMEEAIFQTPSEMLNVKGDPRLRDAQLGALSKLAEVSKGGMTMQDSAMLDQIRRQVDTQAHGADDAILQNMQARGMGGSGAELAARLSGSQAAANRKSSEGLQVGGLATQRALEAIMNRGTLGGQIRSQDFNEDSSKAKAQDEINRFNSANRQAVMSRNVGASNAAQAANLNAKQKVMDGNVDISNREQEYNKRLLQTDYENRLRKAQGIYAGNIGQAGMLRDEDQRSNDKFSGIASGVTSVAGAMATKKYNDDYLDILRKKYSSDAKAPDVSVDDPYSYGNSSNLKPSWEK